MVESAENRVSLGSGEVARSSFEEYLKARDIDTIGLGSKASESSISVEGLNISKSSTELIQFTLVL